MIEKETAFDVDLCAIQVLDGSCAERSKRQQRSGIAKHLRYTSLW